MSVLESAHLNESQLKATTTTEGPLLVLAGAGSGKTRVLTYRIAHLVVDKGLPPYHVLAITFTNKAAREMKDRLANLLPYQTRGMWVLTFHGMCVRILRDHAEHLGYSSDFTIYDDDDSKRLVKEIMNALGIDHKDHPINSIRSLISTAKNELIDAAEFKQSHAHLSTRYNAASRVYTELTARLQRAQAMDFDDLLVNTYKLLRDQELVLRSYQERFLYIHVDEYQDTNKAQYEIVRLLAGRHRNLMVVGDDDQSIYSWRGADIRNILEFEQDYPDATVVKLEQNYRSTGHILEAAHAVVSRNSARTDKHLYTEAGMGEKIDLYQASDERDEGRWIASEIEQAHSSGTPYKDMAVFYRTNAQSRVLEDMMLRAGVSYRIVGGVRFFDRAEIRDVMAYLKVVVNPDDDMAAKRVINTPRRGIGDTTVSKLEKDAARLGISFYQAAHNAIAEDSTYSMRVRTALTSFVNIIEQARGMQGSLRDVVDAIVASTGLVDALKSEGTYESQSRIENIEEFLSVAEDFENTTAERDEDEAFERALQTVIAAYPDADEQAFHEHLVEELDNQENQCAQSDEDSLVSSVLLGRFVEWLALRSDLDSLSDQDDYVTLMTVHSAKGLEFPLVFVAGLEEGIFPHKNSDFDPQQREEERRLAYVALTRAMRKLKLSYAERRSFFGTSQSFPPSCFLSEIPQEHIIRAGIGSAGYSGTGWEKRGDRRGTFGSGVGQSMYGGAIHGASTRSQNSSERMYGGRELFSSGYGLEPSESEGYVYGSPSNDRSARATSPASYAPQDRVSHKVFGKGTVLSVDDISVTIRFDKSGKTKRLMPDMAPLVKINEG